MRISHADPVVPRHVVFAARLAHYQQRQAQEQRPEVHVTNLSALRAPGELSR